MLKAAIVGFGGIAKSHRMGYAHLEEEGKVELVAACDINPEAFTRKIEINIDAATEELAEHINFYTDIDEMLEKEDIDFIDICLPTFLHKEMSVYLLKKGYNVLCEKPMSLTYDECTEMIEAAKNSGKELMIAQCLRFSNAHNYAKTAIEDGRFGRVLGAYFARLSAPPRWSWENWFMNPERSGGCLTDLHIHDVDMIRYLFGEPTAVSCHATTSICKHDTVHSSFFYGDTPVTAIGDWTLTGMPFKSEFRIDFENATLDCKGYTITIYPKDGGESYQPEYENTSAYESEISFFCDVLDGKCENTVSPATSAAKTIKLVEALRASADANGKVVKFNTEN